MSTTVGTSGPCVDQQVHRTIGGMEAIRESTAHLNSKESLALLATAPVGRIVFTRGALPAIHPVSFVLDGDDVIISAGEDLALISAVADSIVAFEADEIDAANNDAWSVVVTGRAELVTDPQVVDRLQDVKRGWTRSAKSAQLLRIRPEIVSGRRFGTPR
jgi:uncharacterized protein